MGLCPDISAELIGRLRLLAEEASRDSPFPAVAMDTEFMRSRHFYPEPCVMQLCLPSRLVVNTRSSGTRPRPADTLSARTEQPDGSSEAEQGDSEDIWLIDLLVAPALDRLQQGLAGLEVVMHACQEDLEVLQVLGLAWPERLFDTQVAATLAGFGKDAGLQATLRNVLGAEVEKDAARSDWKRRPLSDAQVAYARDDVRYLLPLRQALIEALTRKGRMAWFAEDMAALRARTERLLNADAADGYTRLSGVGRLELSAQYRCSLLYPWRERWARAVNIPRRRFCTDDALIELARVVPGNLSHFTSICRMPGSVVREAGEEALALLRLTNGKETPPQFTGVPAPLPKTAKPVYQAIKAAVERVAHTLSLPPEILAGRRALEGLTRLHLNQRIREGAEVLGEWRWQQLEKTLMDPGTFHHD